MIAGNRLITYLRISVTDRCNFRCRYCVPAFPFSFIPHHRIAAYEEILRITRLACDMGITKVRITGGEPFVRKGIFAFLEQLCQVPQLTDVTITTNGSLLTRDKLHALMDMGITRLNFSLDTLQPDRFAAITGRDRFDRVWHTIQTASELGMVPIKINAVVLRHINFEEVDSLAALTRKFPFHVRFIEYMPMGEDPLEKTQQVLSDEIQQKIETVLGPMTPVPPKPGDGPARTFQLSDAKGVLGFISPISSHFCSECNRLRLTSRGTLRPCLLHDYEKDILSPLRNGLSDNELKALIQDSLGHKPQFHHLADNRSTSIPVSHMTSIGG